MKAKARQREQWLEWTRRAAGLRFPAVVDRETVIEQAAAAFQYTTSREVVEAIERNLLEAGEDPYEVLDSAIHTALDVFECHLRGIRTVYILQDGPHFYLISEKRPVVDLRSRFYWSLRAALDVAEGAGFTHYRRAGVAERLAIADVPPDPKRSILDIAPEADHEQA